MHYEVEYYGNIRNNINDETWFDVVASRFFDPLSQSIRGVMLNYKAEEDVGQEDPSCENILHLY